MPDKNDRSARGIELRFHRRDVIRQRESTSLSRLRVAVARKRDERYRGPGALQCRRHAGPSGLVDECPMDENKVRFCGGRIDAAGRRRRVYSGANMMSDLHASDYGMFFASAGFASVYDYPGALKLHAVAEDVWRRGGIVAAVCHGGAIFTGIKDAETGQSVIAGKEVTGFSTEGDELAGVLNRIHSDGVKTTEESVRMAGANYVAPHPPFDAFMVASGRVVTGAKPASCTHHECCSHRGL